MKTAGKRRGSTKTCCDVPQGRRRPQEGRTDLGWTDALQEPYMDSEEKRAKSQAPDMQTMVEEFVRKTKKMRKVSRRQFKDLNKELQSQLGTMQKTSELLVCDSKDFLQWMDSVERKVHQHSNASAMRLKTMTSQCLKEPKYQRMCRQISEKLRLAQNELQQELRRLQR